MKRAYVCVAVLGAMLGMAGCSSDDDSKSGGSKGGSCTTPDQCFHVTSPADYDITPECSFVSGTWSKDPCNPAGYVKKCTDKSMVSINDGPEQEVTYVYFYPAGSTEDCFGVEEPL